MSSCILAHEPSWRDDDIVAVSLFLGVVATFDGELLGHVAVGAGPEHNAV